MNKFEFNFFDQILFVLTCQITWVPFSAALIVSLSVYLFCVKFMPVQDVFEQVKYK